MKTNLRLFATIVMKNIFRGTNVRRTIFLWLFLIKFLKMSNIMGVAIVDEDNDFPMLDIAN